MKKLTGVEEFLKGEHPEEFDFRDLMQEYYQFYKELHLEREFDRLLEKLPAMVQERDPVSKWFQYKTLDSFCSNFHSFDCDNSNGSCKLSDEIYRLLWDEAAQRPCFQDGHYTGETMNLLAATLGALLGHKLKGEWTWPRCKKLYARSDTRQTLLRAIQSAGGAEDFFAAAHRIGNLTLWPAGCNGPRGRGEVRDYWDLTLWYIYRWYQDGAAEHLEKIAPQRMGALATWLSVFQGWDDFVEKNYMQDYTAGPGRPYGRPKPFWEGHFTPGHACPESMGQIEAYFTNAAGCIRARSARMVGKLRRILR